MGAGALAKRVLGRIAPSAVVVKGRRSSAPRVALTFDDGPHEAHTPRILDALDAQGARATFFLQGREVERHPGLAREIVARGHEVGNHGHSHYDAKRVPLGTYVADVARAHEVLEQALGKPVGRIFRPPHGSVTGASFLWLARKGYRFVFWSADTRDSFIRTPDELVAHVEGLGLGDGDIVLLHEDYAHTVESLPRILRPLAERSLAFARIGEL
jgi:peptidoglycan/xylan/chitin deacetylase (PgdA/CDA1 family)